MGVVGLIQEGAKDHNKTCFKQTGGWCLPQIMTLFALLERAPRTLGKQEMNVFSGIPASEINSKSGSCPRPLGISVFQDNTIGCWMDSNCPGIQKCCVEPNPVTNSATRICRDPVGIASKNGKIVLLKTEFNVYRHINLLPSPSRWILYRSSCPILL